MYIKGKYNWLKHLDFMFLDLVVLICSFIVSYFFKFNNNGWWIQEQWLMLLVLICLLNIVISFLENRYSGVLKKRLYEDVIKTSIHMLYMITSASFIFYILKIGAFFSREMFLTMTVIYFVSGIIVRYIWRKIISKKRLNNKRLLYVVCDKENEEEVLQNAMAESMESYQVVGISSGDGFVEDLLKIGAQEVLIALKPGNVSNNTYESLIANGIGIHINIETMVGFQTEEQFITRVGVYKTLGVGVYSFTPRQMFYLWIKRSFDIICGLVGLIVLIPLSLIVKVVYLSKGDKKSIFYTQERVGKDGKIIKIFKFRSMVSNADEVLQELLKDEKYRKEWEETQKFENDPRITKVGNFLRKTSLDEIPQLLNVLAGDMSLVGPRPLVEGELEAHDGLKLYNKVKPGITGWWGCNGRSNLEYRKRLELEYYYVKHCSLYLDIVCIFRTILAVLKRDGSK
ncbi:undecaprenyl-phosphate galactose phosphotransferase [Enterococcus sp. DIV0837a]|uniref:exopolysaccharide biosynthesis polyprenyl glycosylphosphotransferase n=1 Tax=Enterococcus sp. DIV0837a TaxID=2774811 RepID=UPI003849113E|nr:exopolysaccharide biosynthesis polyprenyl glycosylphosphotransferase [Enterococcus faecium]